ncbi:UbiA family prenyltransferase [Lacunimicrobium album]
MKLIVFNYARLMRLPLVLSVVADILLGGLLLKRDAVTTSDVIELAILAAASACLYLAGMVFNDLFDVKQDTQERPDRPIPSGAVSWMSALILGIALIAGGIGLASVANEFAMYVAMGLAGVILFYDGFKHLPFAPLVMGLCRGGNVLLGSTHAWPLGEPRVDVVILGLVIIAMICFIAGITFLARTEAIGISKEQIARCEIGYIRAFVLLFTAFLMEHGVGDVVSGQGPIRAGEGWLILIGTLVVAYRFDRWFRQRVVQIELAEKKPPLIGRTVGQMLGYYPLLASLTLVTIRPSMWSAALLIALLRWGIVWGRKYIPIT